MILKLRTSCNECLTSLVTLVLDEVLLESLCEILRLLLPLRCICISVARIEDSRIYTWKLGRNLEIEERDLLGRSLGNIAILDSSDDSTSILDGDSLAPDFSILFTSSSAYFVG